MIMALAGLLVSGFWAAPASETPPLVGPFVILGHEKDEAIHHATSKASDKNLIKSLGLRETTALSREGVSFL